MTSRTMTSSAGQVIRHKNHCLQAVAFTVSLVPQCHRRIHAAGTPGRRQSGQDGGQQEARPTAPVPAPPGRRRPRRSPVADPDSSYQRGQRVTDRLPGVAQKVGTKKIGRREGPRAFPRRRSRRPNGPAPGPAGAAGSKLQGARTPPCRPRSQGTATEPRLRLPAGFCTASAGRNARPAKSTRTTGRNAARSALLDSKTTRASPVSYASGRSPPPAARSTRS
jgi:hypothetical protein